MNLTAILVGAAKGIGSVLAYQRWSEVTNWLKDFVSKLAKIFLNVAQGISHAAAVFIQTLDNGLSGIVHKLYYKEGEQYIEKTTVRTVPESELPSWAKAKLNGTQPVEVTKDFAAELQMQI